MRRTLTDRGGRVSGATLMHGDYARMPVRTRLDSRGANATQRNLTSMPYVERNASGAIVALTAEPGPSSREQLPATHPDVLHFLSADAHSQGEDGLLAADLKMIRVIEDVIDLLVSKNVIMFSELPVPVQSKILAKKGQREKLFGSGGSILSEGDIL